MTVNIAGYNFDGSYAIDAKFSNVPGIYVIYTSSRYLDVGETDKLGERILNHERKGCWEKHAAGMNIYLAFLRIDDANKRLALESALRNFLNPTCGDR